MPARDRVVGAINLSTPLASLITNTARFVATPKPFSRSRAFKHSVAPSNIANFRIGIDL